MIGIIGALRIEVENLKAKMTDASTEVVSSIPFTTGRLNGVPVVVAVSGVGKVFAAVCAQIMILKYGVGKIINIGVAGTVDESLNVGDLVISSQVCQHDMDTSAVGDPKGMVSGVNLVYFPADKALGELAVEAARENGIPYKTGVIASGDQFVADKPKGLSIRREFDASAVEMEAGSIGQVCYINNIPFLSLRVISDDASEEAHVSYADFLKWAAARTVGIVLDIVDN